ncbi:hypothetical protein HPB51_010438 [Rhipicephalus microplus]|uniref:Uncharacterized protein n=1 Tax=Rhipicephalus microplus TaxID=6941 RepID=A0A9J6E8G9_RHIMP|nr:hypothetical protein HPB51_010438 [Rhipicephalus microplus]
MLCCHVPSPITTTQDCKDKRSLKDHLVPVVLHAKSIEADLAESPVTAAALVHIRKCTQLEKLTFSSVRSNDSLCEMSLLETVKCFQNLRWLELSGVSAVTDTVLAAIAEQNKLLTVLKLNECVNIGDGGLEALGRNCHFLKSLDFSSTQVSWFCNLKRVPLPIPTNP